MKRTRRRKFPGEARICVRSREILQRALEEGIAHGWRRAHKHVEYPLPEDAQAYIFDEIMLAIDEVFVFEELPL